jgi:hypothetical protein
MRAFIATGLKKLTIGRRNYGPRLVKILQISGSFRRRNGQGGSPSDARGRRADGSGAGLLTKPVATPALKIAPEFKAGRSRRRESARIFNFLRFRDAVG